MWIWSTTYRLPLVRQDVNGNPVVAEEALVDVDGNPWLDEAGRPIDYADCGAVRVVSLYGDAEVWPTFERLAADAGHLLSNSPSLIRDHFAPETPAMQPEPLRWICAVFDLPVEAVFSREEFRPMSAEMYSRQATSRNREEP